MTGVNDVNNNLNMGLSLDDDIGKIHNLYAKKPEVVARLSEELKRIEHSGSSRPVHHAKGQ